MKSKKHEPNQFDYVALAIAITYGVLVIIVLTIALL